MTSETATGCLSAWRLSAMATLPLSSCSMAKKCPKLARRIQSAHSKPGLPRIMAPMDVARILAEEEEERRPPFDCGVVPAG